MEPIVLIDGELNLVKRRQSKYIYARYKHPKTGRWDFKGTKKQDVKEAREFALKWYYGFNERVEAGLPTTTHKMNRVIDLYLEKLDEAWKHDQITKSNYEGKCRVVAKWVRPFFGDKLLHSINRSVLMEFADYRKNYYANQPEDAVIEYMRRNGTIGHRPIQARERKAQVKMIEERAVINSLFRVAANKGWIQERDIPKVNFRSDVVARGKPGSKIKPDYYFTVKEIAGIKWEMQDWSNNDTKFRYRRQAAYYYVMLCFTTGVRPGSAMDNIRWCDIQAIPTGDVMETITHRIGGEDMMFEQQQGGDPVGSVRLQMNVPVSKVGDYTAIGLNEAFGIYNDWKMAWMLMAQDLKNMNDRRAKRERRPVRMEPRREDPIFLLPNDYLLQGNVVSKYFSAYLEAYGRTYKQGAPHTQANKRTLYSNRHSFITHMRALKVPDSLIAAFTGTSREMFEKHYGHDTIEQSGDLFPNFDAKRER